MLKNFFQNWAKKVSFVQQTAPLAFFPLVLAGGLFEVSSDDSWKVTAFLLAVTIVISALLLPFSDNFKPQKQRILTERPYNFFQLLSWIFGWQTFYSFVFVLFYAAVKTMRGGEFNFLLGFLQLELCLFACAFIVARYVWDDWKPNA